MLAHLATLADAGQVAEQLLDSMTPAEAIANVAKVTGLPSATVAARLAHRRRQAAIRARFARDRQIMRLARAGYSNAEIGAKVGLHPGSVSRIVRSRLRCTPEK